jgi:ParB-like chromosome segregation protein Spo0J
VLVGHRRLQFAEELKIKPVIKVLTFGSGDDADVERLRLALVSNIGGQPLTKKDRQHLAEYLYGRGWTMERIGEGLGTTKGTISKDLSEIVSNGNNQNHAKTETNPKGSGRPKGSQSKSEAPPKPHAKAPEIVTAHDEGIAHTHCKLPTGVGWGGVVL